MAAREALPLTAGRIQVAGIASPVGLLRDARGIPHIEAATPDDAWFGLGFAHAQDRLAQILWLRRLARGRTAEVVGEACREEGFWGVRREMVGALAKSKSAEAVKILASLFEVEENPRVLMDLVNGAGTYRDERMVRALEGLLDRGAT